MRRGVQLDVQMAWIIFVYKSAILPAIDLFRCSDCTANCAGPIIRTASSPRSALVCARLQDYFRFGTTSPGIAFSTCTGARCALFAVRPSVTFSLTTLQLLFMSLEKSLHVRSEILHNIPIRIFPTALPYASFWPHQPHILSSISSSATQLVLQCSRTYFSV